MARSTHILSSFRHTCQRQRCFVRLMSSQSSAKQEGDISSVFTSLSGGETKPLPERFGILKRDLIRGHEKELEDSWRRLLRRLATENELIATKGSAIVPQIDFKDIMSRPKEFEDEVRLRGVAVIKGVVPEDEARAYKTEVEDYVRANPWTKAFPQHAPAVFELYWSQPQMKARSHPNLVSAQKYLMSLWHSGDPNARISLTEPLAYADRVRIRQPGDAGFALGPHVDGGSVERWETTGYGKGHVYDKIFAGKWEEYDPWESSGRLSAVADLYNSPGGCAMYRMFQGWLSMSKTAPNEGTLRVNPLLQLSTAYLMLRPFFTPIKPLESKTSENDATAATAAYLHETNWTLEQPTTTTLQGAGPAVCQELNDTLHPHLNLPQTMISVPAIKPGDFVLWHCDTIHAVDKVHAGTSDSSVLYIPVCPLTETNASYLARQRDTFLSGVPGPDFPGGKGESEHQGRSSLEFLEGYAGRDGLRAMGFEKFEVGVTAGLGEREVVRRANEILGFV